MVLIYREVGSWCPAGFDLTFAAAQHFTPSSGRALNKPLIPDIFTND
jgi:hypothetical protein